MELVRVKQGEKVPRSVTVEGTKVIRKHVTEHGRLGDVLLTWSFDFERVSHEDIMELASRAVLIGARPKFKKSSVVEAATWDNRVFSVADYLSNEHVKLSPVEAANQRVSALSAEQKADLIKQLQRELQGEREGVAGEDDVSRGSNE